MSMNTGGGTGGPEQHANRPIPYDRTPQPHSDQPGPASGRGIDRNRYIVIGFVVVLLAVGLLALFR